MIDPADLRDVFDRAASLPPQDRAAFLARACGDNLPLRQEVERLLAADARAGSVLGTDSSNSAETSTSHFDVPRAGLTAGTKLGPYVIVSALGAGGMGEVYRARDPRLNREVAIKVLPADRFTDEGRRRRFVQEAQAASALNHPHIVTIHEIEAHGDRDFIVMEFVRGKSLETLIPRQGMRLSEALRVAIPVADALAAAHARGIVHRDLKPANVMVGADGSVKVLDFGLAKLLSADSRPDDETATHAVDAGLSAPGMIAGTAAYMSPEQATGQPVDARSDIFSFGAMLYEMVTGQRAFAGTSMAETLASVIRAQPKNPSAVVSGVPADLEKIILRCLRKDPERRFHHAADVRVALLEVKEDSESGQPITAAAIRPARPGRKLVLGGLIALLAAVSVATWWRLRPQVRQPPKQVSIWAITGEGRGHAFPQLSPDGQKLAYAWSGPRDDNWDIYVRAVEPGSRPVRLTEDPDLDSAPAWSPDGTQVAFERDHPDGTCTIYSMPSLGGQERKLADFRQLGAFMQNGVSWSPDGQWLAVGDKPPREPARIVRLAITSQVTRPLTTPPAHVFGDFEPAIAPDGRSFAFVRGMNETSWGQQDVWIQSIEDGQARQVTFGRFGRLMALGWTPDSKEIVFTAGDSVFGGTLLRVPAAGGEVERLVGVGENAAHSSIVGSRMAYVQTQRRYLSIWRIPNTLLTHLKVEPVQIALEGLLPAYSPDDTSIAFQSGRESKHTNIWLTAADGSHPTQITDVKTEAGTPGWSPDGRRVAFDSMDSGSYDVWVVDAAGGTPKQLTHEPSEDGTPSWSRDGKWIYFHSNRSGDSEIWKISADGGEARQVTHAGGFYARESRDGTRLFYNKAFPLVHAPKSGGGIWQMSLATGETTQFIHDFLGFAEWDVGRHGIYFWGDGGHGERDVKYRSFDSGRDVVLYRNTEGIAQCLSVSADEHWLLYTHLPNVESDVMVMENFR